MVWLSKIFKTILFCLYYFSNTPFYIVFVLFSLLALFGEYDNNYLKSFCTFFVLFLSMSSAVLVVVLNFDKSFNFVEKLVGYKYIDTLFPLSKIGIRALFPVTVFFFTFLLLILIESYSIGSQVILREEKIGEMERKARELGDANLFAESFKETDHAIEELSKPREFKGILGKMINHPKISYYLNYFRVGK